MDEIQDEVINAKGVNSLIFKVVAGALLLFMSIIGWFIQDLHSDFKVMQETLIENSQEISLLKKELEQRNIQDEFYKEQYIEKRFEAGMLKIQNNTDRIIDLAEDN